MSNDLFNELYGDLLNDEGFILEEKKLEITTAICRLMKKKGLNKSQLAKNLNKSRQWVSKLLSGNNNFTLATLVSTFKALGEDFEFRVKDSRSITPLEVYKYLDLFSKSIKYQWSGAGISESEVCLHNNSEPVWQIKKLNEMRFNIENKKTVAVVRVKTERVLHDGR